MVAEDTRKLYIKGAQIITEQYLLNPKANIGNFIETLAKTGTKITDEDQKEIQSLHTKINSINPQEQKNEIDNYWKNVAEHTYHIELSQNDLDQILTPPKITTKQTEKKIEKESEKTAKQDNEVEKTKKNPFLEILDKTGAVLNEGGRRLGMSIGNFFKDNEPDAVEDAEDDPKGNKQKRSSLKTKRYYYVWWLFESKEEFETLRKKHSYPRNRGKDKPYYRELPVKTINDALAGNIDATKDKSNVQGYFLGALGLTARNTKFTDTVNFPEGLDTSKLALLNNKEGPLIALGVAQAKRSIIRSILTKKLRFDVQRLNWKWHVWTGKGKGKKPVTVLVVDQTVFDDHKQRGTLPDLFKKGSPNFEGAEISLKKNGKKAGSKNADNEGKATITCEFNDEIELTAKYTNYVPGTPQYPVTNPITINQTLEYVIIPMPVKGNHISKNPELLVMPSKKPRKHERALQSDFGSSQAHYYVHGDGKGYELSFNIKALSKDTKVTNEIWIETFIVTKDRQLVQWNSMNSQVSIIRRKNKANDGKFNESISIKKGVTTEPISIVTTFDKPQTITGKYDLYCVAKKTPEKLSDGELQALFTQSSKVIENKIWDYNFIEFEIKEKGDIPKKLLDKADKPSAKKTPAITSGKEKKDYNKAVNDITKFIKKHKSREGQPITNDHTSLFWSDKKELHDLEKINDKLKDINKAHNSALLKAVIDFIEVKANYDKHKEERKLKWQFALQKQIQNIKSMEPFNTFDDTIGGLFRIIEIALKDINLINPKEE